MDARIAVAIFLCFATMAIADGAIRHRRNTQNEYKMCVPEQLMEACRNMSQQETKSASKIVCVAARDRIECLDKIQKRLADFGAVEPEDVYVASKIPEQDLAVFEEIRTKVEPDAEFRYEAVAVVHKDTKLGSVAELKGLKSCHTGVGRNVGYKIPLTKLKKMGVVGPLNDPELSARENELRAFSELFSKACIVGKWSPDPAIDAKLKKRYSNLCELCENPAVCDYPDVFSGYDGALRCLARNGGQIAWTKVIYVRSFFGLPVGGKPGKKTDLNAGDYAYFCPDGSRVPITDEKACTWAARPWPGYLTNAAVLKTVDELRRKIENLNKVGEEAKAPWLESVLELGEGLVARGESGAAAGAGEYLAKANYTDVVERDYGPPYKTVRMCVVSSDELEKCRAFSGAAFARDVRPRFDCVEEKSVRDCLKTIRDNGADVITLDGGLVEMARRDYNLKPVLAEDYGGRGAYYAVAVVKKSSPYKSFADLKGAKSCHTGVGRTAGYNAPLYVLLKQNLVKKTDCPYPAALSSYFSAGSCLPGAREPERKIPESVADKLCSLCVGDVASETHAATKCNFDSSESYSGYTGAFRCLVEGGGDVAFVKHVTVPGNTDGKNPDPWASQLHSSDYELLCPEGGRVPVDQYEKCHLAKAPPHMVVTSNAKTESETDEIKNALISAARIYAKRPDLFRLFGSFNGKKDLLFKDSATGLVSVDGETDVQKEYAKVLNVVNACKSSQGGAKL